MDQIRNKTLKAFISLRSVAYDVLFWTNTCNLELDWRQFKQMAITLNYYREIREGIVVKSVNCQSTDRPIDWFCHQFTEADNNHKCVQSLGKAINTTNINNTTIGITLKTSGWPVVPILNNFCVNMFLVFTYPILLICPGFKSCEHHKYWFEWLFFKRL